MAEDLVLYIDNRYSIATLIFFIPWVPCDILSILLVLMILLRQVYHP